MRPRKNLRRLHPASALQQLDLAEVPTEPVMGSIHASDRPEHCRWHGLIHSPFSVAHDLARRDPDEHRRGENLNEPPSKRHRQRS